MGLALIEFRQPIDIKYGEKKNAQNGKGREDYSIHVPVNKQKKQINT